MSDERAEVRGYRLEVWALDSDGHRTDELVAIERRTFARQAAERATKLRLDGHAVRVKPALPLAECRRALKKALGRQ